MKRYNRVLLAVLLSLAVLLGTVAAADAAYVVYDSTTDQNIRTSASATCPVIRILFNGDDAVWTSYNDGNWLRIYYVYPGRTDYNEENGWITDQWISACHGGYAKWWTPIYQDPGANQDGSLSAGQYASSGNEVSYVGLASAHGNQNWWNIYKPGTQENYWVWGYDLNAARW